MVNAVISSTTDLSLLYKTCIALTSQLCDTFVFAGCLNLTVDLVCNASGNGLLLFYIIFPGYFKFHTVFSYHEFNSVTGSSSSQPPVLE